MDNRTVRSPQYIIERENSYNTIFAELGPKQPFLIYLDSTGAEYYSARNSVGRETNYFRGISKNILQETPLAYNFIAAARDLFELNDKQLLNMYKWAAQKYNLIKDKTAERRIKKINAFTLGLLEYLEKQQKKDIRSYFLDKLKERYGYYANCLNVEELLNVEQ